MTTATETGLSEFQMGIAWWRSQPEMIQNMIRNFAIQELINYGFEEVGSSDVNCSVVNVYREFLSSGTDNVCTFLIDRMMCHA